MRAFLVFLAISAVSGDAKPYTVAQVAAGLPVQNAVADGRLHNIGVIPNAAQAGVKTVHCGPACVHISKKLFFSDFVATILIFAAKCRVIQLCNIEIT